MITYAYERVSSKDQNLDRQDAAIKQFRPDIKEDNIFKDKITGKTFERENYQKMKIILEHITKAYEGTEEFIEVIVEELDRLGRDYEGVKEELRWFKEHGIVVRILEIPTTLTDVNKDNKWVTDMVTQILIEVYASVAQQELEKRAKRQREGIEQALEKGVRFGRKKIEVENNIIKPIYDKWKAGEISSKRAGEELGLKTSTFYRRIEEYEQANGIYDRSKAEKVYDLFKSGDIDDKEACRIMGISIRQFGYYIQKYEEELEKERSKSDN